MRLSFLSFAISLAVGVLALGACSADEDEAPPPGESVGGSGGAGGLTGGTGGLTDGTGGGVTGGTGGTGGTPSTWQRDFNPDSAGINCGMSASELASSAAARVTVGDATIYAGYQQVTGNNQDPVVARVDNGSVTWCEHHENDPPDGRARGVTWDGGDYAYVVYTVVGGGTDLEGKGGWLSAYAPGAISGGGPTVSYVGRVDANNGDLVSGTFIIAVLSSGNVNTHNPRDAVTVLADGTVEFLGESAHKPIDADGRNSMDCTDYPFESRYRFSADLSTLVCADCTNCTPQSPCS